MITKKIRIFLAKNAKETLLTIAAFAIAFVLIPMYFEEDEDFDAYLVDFFAINKQKLGVLVAEKKNNSALEKEGLSRGEFFKFAYLIQKYESADRYIDSLAKGLIVQKNKGKTSFNALEAFEKALFAAKYLKNEPFAAFPSIPNLENYTAADREKIAKVFSYEHTEFAYYALSNMINSDKLLVNSGSDDRKFLAVLPTNFATKIGEHLTGSIILSAYSTLDKMKSISVNNAQKTPAEAVYHYAVTASNLGKQALAVEVVPANYFNESKGILRDTFYYEVIP